MFSSPPQRPPSPGRPFFVDGQHDDTAATSSDEDEDTLRRLVQTFGSKKGGFSYERNGGDCDSCSDTDSSASDDIAYLQRLQEQFVPHSTGYPHAPPIMKPMGFCPSLDTDEEDDFETLRAIQRRFAQYGSEVTPKDFSAETSTFSAGKSEQNAQRNKENPEENHCLSDPFDAPMRTKALNEKNPAENHSNINQGDSFSVRPLFSPRFSKSVQNFFDALKKNRACQRFIREKLMEMEAKIEVNKKLKDHIKCFMNFHAAYKRKVGHSLCQKWDPRVRLISFRKQKSLCTIKENSKTCSALYFAPAKNPQVSNYEMVMRKFPVTLRNRRWSDKEKDKLLNGVKQQCQEMLLLNSMNLGSDVDALDDSIIMSTFDSADQQVTTENIRLFIPFVNWDRLASMYLPKRSGPSCESRWLNHEDPTINCKPWTLLEDKKLLFTVQDRGLYNWIDIALILGTNRTPFQCLARYQRSLNPHILNREWTTEEDAKLHASVKSYGDKNWQIVVSHLDGRTSNQCSVRWRNTLLPERKRVGRWSVNEDKRLKVSVILFGAKNWKNIAQFIPGRTQSQCRERWLNCLDPSLNLERWTGEEDAKLLAAIAEHGHSWSKIAAYIPGRTDNQCRRRWKVLLPHEVSMLKMAQQLKKTVLISNFVGREGERPAIGPNDFTPTLSIPGSDIKNYGAGKKRLRKQSNPGINKNGTRIIHHKRLKSQQREQIDDIIASNNLGEDLLMELPLAQVMKLISRKGNTATVDRNANASSVSSLADGF